MVVRLTTPGVLGAFVLVLAAWMLHGFLPALLVACVTAVATWPLYVRVAVRLRPHMSRSAISLGFTLLVSALVLAPLVFACWALLAKASTLVLEIVAADQKGIGVPHDAERNFRLPESRVIRGDHDVALHGERAAAAERVAGHRRNDRLAHLAEVLPVGCSR